MTDLKSHASRFSSSGPAEVPAWSTGELAWRQPTWRERAWELTRDGERIGSMRSRGLLPEKWDVQGPTGPWRFRSKWTGRTEIFRGEDETPAAVYEPGWLCRGSITTASGEVYSWRLVGLLSRTWVVTNASGFPVLHLTGRRGFLRFGGRVEIDEAGRRLRDLEALVLLAWRLKLLQRRYRSHGIGR